MSRKLSLTERVKNAAKRLYPWHLLDGTGETDAPREILDLMKGPPGSLGGRKRRTTGRSTTDTPEGWQSGWGADPDDTKAGKKLKQHSTHTGGHDVRTVAEMSAGLHGVQGGSWKDQPDRVKLERELADPKYGLLGGQGGAADLHRPFYPARARDSQKRDTQTTDFLEKVGAAIQDSLAGGYIADDVWCRSSVKEMCRRLEAGDKEARADIALMMSHLSRNQRRQAWRDLRLPGEPPNPPGAPRGRVRKPDSQVSARSLKRREQRARAAERTRGRQ